MIVRFFCWKKAVPAIALGMAFFLVGCHPKIPVKGKAIPYYAKLPAIQYKIARDLYLAGEYRHSKDKALKWLEEFPMHSIRGDIFVLLGRDFKAMEDNPQAFYWWLKAKDECLDDVQRQGELNKELEELIETSGVEDLEQLADYAVGSDYAPEIYYRTARIFLQRNELEKAQSAALSMIRSTSEQSWVFAGRELLDRIQEEMSVKRGVVGCLLPLSGPFSIYGEEVLNGIQLGMGILRDSYQDSVLELVIKDTEGKPEQALSGLEDLVKNEKVMAIIGPLSSRTSMAVAGKADELGVPIIALTQKQGITEQGEMVFRNFLTPSQEIKRLVHAATEELGIKRFGILYPDNSYGHFFMNLFWDMLEEMGGAVTAVESYNPDETDFAGQIKRMTGLYFPRPESLVKRLREMWPPEQEESEIFQEEPEPIIDFEAVFIPDEFQRVAMIAPQLAYYDVLDVQLIGTSLWQSPRLIEMAGDYVQGAIFSSGFPEMAEQSGVSTFIEDYRTDFGSLPGVLAATGYDTARLLKMVMAGQDVRTRKDIQTALLGCEDFMGVTGEIFFDPRGEVQKEAFLVTISGKKMTLFE